MMNDFAAYITKYRYLLEGSREEQIKAVTAREPYIAVSAGAGTGKTHTLANRFAWLLLSDPQCKVDEMLTLTFTQAAAEEMRGRIKKTLKKWYASDRRGLAHMKDAIDRIDEAYISTIHSFSIRIIKESGLALDIDPSSSVASAPFERSFWSRFARCLTAGDIEMIKAMLPDASREHVSSTFGAVKCWADKHDIELLNYYSADLLCKLAQASCDSYGSMNLTPDYLKRFGAAEEKRVREKILDQLRPAFEEDQREWREKVFPLFEGPRQKKTNAFYEKLQDFYERHRDDGADSAIESMIDLHRNVLSDLRGRADIKKQIEEELGMALTKYRKRRAERVDIAEILTRDHMFDAEELETRRLLASLAALGWEAWDEAKREHRALAFADMIRYAYAVLKDQPDRARRFKHVMIDEFQDTDGTQNAMIEQLVSAWSTKQNEDADGQEAERTLFIVGDIKQSIYSFRHADPSLFASCCADSGVKKITLDRSFRMNDRLMESINTIFGTIWKDGVISDGSAHAEYEPLVPPADSDQWDERCSEARSSMVEIFVHSQKKRDVIDEDGAHVSKNVDKAERRASLADAVGRRFIEMIESGEKVWHEDKLTNKKYMRPARWSDMAVLVPTRTSYAPLRLSFERLHIPAVFAKSMSYYSRGEVQDLVNMMRALCDPSDELALAGWIESPFSGCRHLSYTEAAASIAASGESIANFFKRKHPEPYARLERLRRIARIVSPAEAALSLLDDTSWLAAYRDADQRARVAANIRKGVQLMKEYEHTMGRDLFAETSYLDEFIREKAPEVEPDGALDGSVDAVRVMTIHASKGLEFPIVAVIGMEKKLLEGDKNKPRVFPSAQLAVIPKDIPERDSKKDPIASRKIVKWLTDPSNADESKRLMYVALTRARERLLLAGVDDPSNDAEEKEAKTWLDLLLAANEENGAPFPVIETSNIIQLPRAAKRGDAAAHMSAAPARALHASRVSAARFTASAFLWLSWCPYAYRARFRQGLEMQWQALDRVKDGGSDVGSLVHHIMRVWDLDPSSLPDVLPECSSRNEIEASLCSLPAPLRPVFTDAANRSTIAKWLRSFAATEEAARFRELISRRALMREVSFSAPFEGCTLVGAIDVCWEDENGMHIRDWKTALERGRPDSFYDEQLNFYAFAVHLLKPSAQIDVALIHLRPEDADAQPHARRITDWHELEERIRRMKALAVQDRFEPDLERCPRCPLACSCMKHPRAKIHKGQAL